MPQNIWRNKRGVSLTDVVINGFYCKWMGTVQLCDYLTIAYNNLLSMYELHCYRSPCIQDGITRKKVRGRHAAARSKSCVCGCSLAGIAGSNPVGGWMSVSCECWVLSGKRSLRQADHSSRGVLQSVVEFEPTIPASARPKTHALDLAALG
jgi:hypothetical protein